MIIKNKKKNIKNNNRIDDSLLENISGGHMFEESLPPSYINILKKHGIRVFKKAKIFKTDEYFVNGDRCQANKKELEEFAIFLTK